MRSAQELGLVLKPLGFPWITRDPFLFCVHHNDAYPPGNEHLGPAASLGGRTLGQDFANKDGWNMYHGRAVPGFPQHPHRGFETVTIVRRGLIDHSDSLGATARFGRGDVQWMTAGRGIVHCEMFPLLERDKPNPAELFQLWLNLPAQNKMTEPHFSMLWGEKIPRKTVSDEAGNATELVFIAGPPAGEAEAPSPPPRSWASDPANEVAIWTLKLAPHARYTLPAARVASVNRSLYFFSGDSLSIAGQKAQAGTAIEFATPGSAEIVNGASESELLLLQGKPIGQVVVQYGPFVMNSRAELQQAFLDYQKTQFGGWPWPSDEPTHPRGQGRFAIHADGRREDAEP
jgi:hypothetical protein